MMSKYTIAPLFQSDFPVTQVYGNNPTYYGQFGLAGHEGVDFGTPNGTPFISPFDGIILRDTFNDKDYGNFTVVWDPVQLYAVWFCHLQDVTTNPGDKVSKGQVLGHTNNSGNTTGPHCHVNFVETDSLGNRLNKDNGYQGFLNILDTNLVSIVQGGTIAPTNTMPPYLQTLFQEQSLDPGNEGAVRTFWQQALDFPACNTDKLSAQTALGTANNKVAELQGSLTNAQAAITQQNGVIENTKLQLTASDNTITTLTNKINGMQPPQIKSPITLFFFNIFG